MDRLSDPGNDNAPGRLRGAEIGPDDFARRILITCVVRSLFGHDAMSQIGMGLRRSDQPISMAQMPVPVPISKTLMGLLSASGAKCSLS